MSNHWVSALHYSHMSKSSFERIQKLRRTCERTASIGGALDSRRYGVGDFKLHGEIFGRVLGTSNNISPLKITQASGEI